MVRRKMRQILVYSMFFSGAPHKSGDSAGPDCYNRRFPGSSLADVRPMCVMPVQTLADAGLRAPSKPL
jgi:hypothetical protein